MLHPLCTLVHVQCAMYTIELFLHIINSFSLKTTWLCVILLTIMYEIQTRTIYIANAPLMQKVLTARL